MVTALDIETIANVEMVDLLPEAKIDSRLKDPKKIEEAIEAGRQKQIDAMALDALTARVCTFACVDEDSEGVKSIESIDDNGERALLGEILSVLGQDGIRICTWNGIGFDLPMIYKRAMILGVEPREFGAPSLSAWTVRYNTNKHFDLMQIWGNWSSRDYAKLDTVARLVLRERKDDLDVTKIAEMLQTREGTEQVEEYCLQDTRLTYRLWERFEGFLLTN